MGDIIPLAVVDAILIAVLTVAGVPFTIALILGAFIGTVVTLPLLFRLRARRDG